jgi:hypothetical protein
MSAITVKDGTKLFYKDSGKGQTSYLGRHGSKRVDKDDVQIHVAAVREPKRKMVVGLLTRIWPTPLNQNYNYNQNEREKLCKHFKITT